MARCVVCFVVLACVDARRFEVEGHFDAVTHGHAVAMTHGLRTSAQSHLGIQQSLTAHAHDVGTVRTHEVAAHGDVKPLVMKTTQTSFGDRIRGAIFGFVGGIILLILSVPILWLNERRGAQMEGLISQGRSQCRSVSGMAANIDNINWLVHVEGEQMRAITPVADDQFNVSFDSGCVRLRREVEVYQVIEEEHKHDKEKLGGSKETTTTYTYIEQWSNSWHNSGIYADRSMDRNTKPVGLDLGLKTTNCDRVEFGTGFLLTESLVTQCKHFEGASKLLPAELQFSKCALLRTDDDYGNTFFYCSATGSSSMKTPAIGDARVRFSYVPDSVVTVMALQAEAEAEQLRGTFLPYRVIQRRCCGIHEEEEKRLLQIEASKTASQLAKEAGCIESLACICCACDLVMKFFASAFTPEICHLLQGSKSQNECFEALSMENRLKSWVFRVVGWLMMFFGLHLLFQPFLTLLVILPFIGPWLSSFGSGLVWFLSFFTTLIISSIIVIIAYLLYRPAMAVVYFLGTSLLVGGIIALTS